MASPTEQYLDGLTHAQDALVATGQTLLALVALAFLVSLTLLWLGGRTTPRRTATGYQRR